MARPEGRQLQMSLNELASGRRAIARCYYRVVSSFDLAPLQGASLRVFDSRGETLS